MMPKQPGFSYKYCSNLSKRPDKLLLQGFWGSFDHIWPSKSDDHLCVCALRRSSIRQGERSAATTGLRDAPIVQTVDIEVAFVLDAGCGLPAIQVSWGLGGLSYRWSMLIPMIPSCWFQAIAMTAMIHFKEQPSQGRQANHSDKSTSWLSDIINQSIPITIPSFCLWLPERPLLD